MCVAFYCLCNGLRSYRNIVHRFKSLISHPFDLLVAKAELSSACRKGERVESHMPLRRDFTVQLTDRTAAEVSRILVRAICIDLLKITVADDGFTPYDHLSFFRDRNRDIGKGPRIGGDDFSNNAVASCHCLRQAAVLVGQNNGQPVKFPGQQSILVAQPAFQLADFLCLVQRKHRRWMWFFRQTAYDLITNIYRRTLCHDDAGFLLKGNELIIKGIVLLIGHDLRVLLIVGLRSFIQFIYKFFNSLLHLI